MPATLPLFAINDAESIDQNLQRFGELLKHLDPELGAILASNLRDLADTDPTDLQLLWQSLFDSLAPPAAEEEAVGGEDGEEEIVA